jgi:hypothetical protein
VLEPTMSRAWIEQIGQSELMDMPQSLEGSRIKNLYLSWLKPYEIMDWVSDLMI